MERAALRDKLDGDDEESSWCSLMVTPKGGDGVMDDSQA